MTTPAATPAKPPTLIRLARATDEREPCCGENIAVVVDSNGPHAAALRCHACGAFRGWLAREAVHFLAEINSSFGTLAEVPVLTDRRRVAARGDGDLVAAMKGVSDMTRDEMFPSRFLSAQDLKGKSVTVTIAAITSEELAGEDGVKKQKPVMSFVKAKKSLVLNLTNWDTCAELYGENSNNWVGKPIEVYPDRTKFGTRTVACIRLRKPPSAAPAPAPAPTPAPAAISTMPHTARMAEQPASGDPEPPPAEDWQEVGPVTEEDLF